MNIKAKKNNNQNICTRDFRCLKQVSSSHASKNIWKKNFGKKTEVLHPTITFSSWSSSISNMTPLLEFSATEANPFVSGSFSCPDGTPDFRLDLRA